MPNPIDMLRDLYKTHAQEADARSRKAAQHWDGSYKFPQNLPDHMIYMGEDLPPVTKPPMMRQQSEVLGGQDFAKGVDNFLTQIPELRGRSPRIQHGPNEPTFERLGRSKFNPWDMELTNLNGATTIDNNHISLNPRLSPGGPLPAHNLESTLGHELGHVVGVEHGPEMDELVPRIQKAFPEKPPVDPWVEAFRKLDARK